MGPAITAVAEANSVENDQSDIQATILEPPPAPPLVQESVPIIISPRPQPIPTVIQQPPYYIIPRPAAPAPPIAVARPTFAAAGLPVIPQLNGRIRIPGLPSVAAQAGGSVPLSIIPRPVLSLPLIRRQLTPVPTGIMIAPNRRILVGRRSVSHDQSGIEQIGTGNNILQGNVQQIQFGSKSKRRGLFCDECFNFKPSESNLFGFKRNVASAISNGVPNVLAQN